MKVPLQCVGLAELPPLQPQASSCPQHPSAPGKRQGFKPSADTGCVQIVSMHADGVGMSRCCVRCHQMMCQMALTDVRWS